MTQKQHFLSLRQSLILGLIAAHFSLIACKAFREYPVFHSALEKAPLIQHASEYYTQLAVLQADYSFFSPNISPDFAVTIEVKEAEGDYQDASFQFHNIEVEKRFHTCVLALQHLSPSLQDIVVKSWAARTIEQFPNAHFVKVRIDRSKLPPMAEYVAGACAEKEIITEVVFQTENAPY